jgi:hypothetical protein
VAVALRAMETGLEGGLRFHMVALGFDPLYKPLNPHRWSATPGGKTAYYQDEMRKLQAAGGVLVLAHPRVDSMTEPIQWAAKQGIIVGVEAHNGRSFIPHGLDWAVQNNLGVFADSDAHGGAARDYTLVFTKTHTAEGVLDAIRAHRTVALYDGVFSGSKEMLSMLVSGMISASAAKENGSDYVVLRNSGPVAMKGTIAGQAIEVPASGQAGIAANGAKTVSVTWDNARVTSTEKLVSEIEIRD